MAGCLVAKVAVEQTAFYFDRLYTYVAGRFSENLQRGCRVLVPFGSGNRCRQGVVMAVEEVPEQETSSFKSLYALPDKQPLLNEELLDLALFLKERTFCTVFDAVRTMIPTGLYLDVKPVYRPVCPLPEDAELTEEETILYRLICSLSRKLPEGVPGDRLLRCAGLSPDSPLPEELVEKGIFCRSRDAFRRLGDATQRMVRPAFPPDEAETVMATAHCTPKQKAVLSLLIEAGAASAKEVCYLAGVTPAVVTALEKKGLLILFDREVLRSPVNVEEHPAREPIVLNEEQRQALEGLVSRYVDPDAACALLYGVTGSGKTQVYLSLIDRVLDDGKQVIVLVPEISLTPQTMNLFLRRYGRRVALLHSGLSVGERMDEWKRIRSGEASVVVGTRSAVFAPCSHLGLIVIDEEQEHTYKSENTPRYHARDVAKFRCARQKALLLLSSATPSLESYYAAISGRYALYMLKERYGEAVLPKTQVVDMRIQPDGELFSEPLRQALRECLDGGHQAILLLNRRGYQTYVSCRSCGKVFTCPSCSIPLTYHRANGRMVCHYCGHIQSPVRRCPDCGSDKIRYSGQGTQKAEEELQRLFPDVPVLRMDTDTTMSRFSYEESFRRFAAGDYRLMIGTQMVAKGLDFPNVTLVGVLSADQALYEGDFRSYETAFSLLTQVVGRAGRRGEPGRAVIQTTVPEHYVIRLASGQDYPGFYEMEIAARKMMSYPPFTDLCQFGFVGKEEAVVRDGANRFLELIRKTVEQPTFSSVPLIVLDPTPATTVRLSGKYRYKLIMKIGGGAVSRRLIATLLTAFSSASVNRGVTVFADRNPLSIL